MPENLNTPAQPHLADSIHDLISGRGEINIGHLPRNLERMCTKRGFDFNLLVAGNYELNPANLIETLFGVTIDATEHDLIEGRNYTTEDAHCLKRGNVNLRLKILTTPNFGMRLNETHSYQPIIRNVKNRLLNYLNQEDELYRKRDMPDNRIHLCLYMFSPAGLAIHPVDLELVSRLTNYCNVVPVIARADYLTEQERAVRKAQILNALDEHQIRYFNLPVGDPELDEPEWVNHLNKIHSKQPFAVMYNQSDYFDRFEENNYNPDDETQSDTSVLRSHS